MDSYQEILKKLAYKHEFFYNSDIQYRIDLAKLVLFNLETKNWMNVNNWVKESCNLEELDISQQYVKQYASLMKFTMGNSIKTWLTNFIEFPKFTIQVEKIDDNNSLYGPFDMGFTGPDIEFKLLCEKSLSKDVKDVFNERARKGTVSLVLGAGNQNFLSFIDVLERIFIHNECVLLKHHPIRPFLFDPYEILFEPLIKENILHMILDDGIENTQSLIHNNIVSHIHFTGSESTFYSINKEIIRKNPLCQLSGELGCATPWVIFPGNWNSNELQNIAKMLVASKKANGGCNCLSVQLLILPIHWEQKQEFMDYLLTEMINQKTFPAYYPNTRIKKEQWLNYYNDYHLPTSGNQNIDDVSIIYYGVIESNGPIRLDTECDCFFYETFGPILVYADLDYIKNDNSDFVNNICTFLNSDKICGSLSCSLFFPSSFPNVYIDKCIVSLNYSTIAINCSNLYGYSAGLMGGIWGSYYKDRRSGRGRIGNTYCLPDVTKTILRGKTLENMKIDLSKPPSKFFMDLLFVLIVRSRDSFDMIYNGICFLFLSFFSIFTHIYAGIDLI